MDQCHASYLVPIGKPGWMRGEDAELPLPSSPHLTPEAFLCFLLKNSKQSSQLACFFAPPFLFHRPPWQSFRRIVIMRCHSSRTAGY